MISHQIVQKIYTLGQQICVEILLFWAVEKLGKINVFVFIKKKI